METVYYNYYAFEDVRASGDEGRHAALVRKRAPRTCTQNNVISLEDYRAKQAALAAEEADLEDEVLSSGTDVERTEARPSLREKLLMGLELAACTALIAVAASACLVFLL